ncbi:hypothetical protein VTL71DRAFT_11273 [Oculimacula yallundae]|uniref:NADP-dependent oxidoreductase domain-containing protein n=1 Tax=Oculimacula yallundae TaxID=86028 RepID=A0ABR4CVT5_9HELO
MPAVGFGTWQAAPKEVEKAVEFAFWTGYRHIDCAAIYRNEQEVGNGIKASGVKREDIFLTDKLWNTKHGPEDVENALDRSLADLGVGYVDLYLMHWPCVFKPGDKFFPLDSTGVFLLDDVDASVTWKAMEALIKTGKTRAIGVSNFNVRRLESLLATATIVPAVNQIELHPYLQQPSLYTFYKQHGIVLTTYSPQGKQPERRTTKGRSCQSA